MYVCVCNAVSERQVREAVKAGATDLFDLQDALGVASCCGRCAEAAESYLPAPAPAAAVGKAAGQQRLEAQELVRTSSIPLATIAA